jgi:hypothetical protein
VGIGQQMRGRTHRILGCKFRFRRFSSGLVKNRNGGLALQQFLVFFLFTLDCFVVFLLYDLTHPLVDAVLAVFLQVLVAGDSVP